MADDPQAERGEAAKPLKFVLGEVFDPRPGRCGFHPVDYTDRSPLLTDGQKRLMDRLFRLAARDGTCYASAQWLGTALGKPARTIEWDLKVLKRIGLIRTVRHGRAAASFEFLFHAIYPGSEAQPIAVQSSLPKDRERAPKPQLVAGQDSGSKPQDSTAEPQPIADKSENPRIPVENPAAASSSSTSEREKVLTFSADACGNSPENSHEVGAVGILPAAKALSRKLDDDDTPPERPETPEEEIRRRLETRHAALIDQGLFDVDSCCESVRKELDGWPLNGFLLLDRAVTRAPGKLANPGGHYRLLARRVRIHAESTFTTGRRFDLGALLAEQNARWEAEWRKESAARYPCCGGTGYSAPNVCCNCKVGQVTQECLAHSKALADAVAAADRAHVADEGFWP